MIRAFKTEIDPTAVQLDKISRTIGVCRYVYNFFLAESKQRYDHGEKYLDAKRFSVWLNNEYLSVHPELSWIKEVYSKAVKKSLEDANTAYMRFFYKNSAYPRFKKKGISDPKMYFVRNNPSDCKCERHRIKIPSLGWVRIKEKGYLPTTKDGWVIKSGTIEVRAGKCYVSVLVEVPDSKPDACKGDGIGIDLGIKDFAILSDERKFKNINKTGRVKKLEKQLRRAQRQLSRKYERNKKKGGATQHNIQRQKLKVQKLHQRMDNIRTDYVNKVIAQTVKTKPSHVTIEDLHVRNMMKNRHLAKAVAAQKFHEFRTKLEAKCRAAGVEVRVVDMWYPSSKTCHCCGRIKKDLKLSDRIFRCSCGYEANRDYNASLNLRDAMIYKLA